MSAPDAPIPDPPKPESPPQTILRSLGQFVGHIVDGIKSDPDVPQGAPAAPSPLPAAPPQSVVVKHEVEEQTRQTPQGVVRVRRTVIEEVELDRDSPGSPPVE